MNQTVKLTALASLLAASALAAGCVPSLNYGSVPPEPKYTTKVTTTTATAATTHPFTTPKPRTGTISWEELNGPVVERSTRARSTEAVHTGYTAVAEASAAGGVGRGGRQRNDDDADGDTVQTAVQGDVTPAAAETAQQTAPPQTDAPLQQVEGPPPQQEEYQPSPAELVPTPQPDPPPAEQPDVFWE